MVQQWPVQQLSKGHPACPYVALQCSSSGLQPSNSSALVQGLAAQLKARDEAASSTERRLEAESRALQQQRQDAELAGMKAQLAVQQQQQQHSPMLSPLLQANPQLGGRSASRLQVCAPSNLAHSGSNRLRQSSRVPALTYKLLRLMLSPPYTGHRSDWRYTWVTIALCVTVILSLSSAPERQRA